MRRYYVNASNEKRTELILWAEDKLFFHEMEKEFRETMEKERRSNFEDHWSEEEKASWERLQKRLEMQNNQSEAEKQAREKELADFFAQVDADMEADKKQDKEMFALLPEEVKSTITDEEDFFDGVMSDETEKRLKEMCMIQRSILILLEMRNNPTE